MYLNKVQLIGNLTRDPEMKALPNGTKVTSFSLATNRTYKDQSGAKKESTEYHNLVSFGRQAEVIAQYAKKGASLYVEGRLQTRSWDDKTSGEKKYRTEILVEQLQLGPRASGAGMSQSAPTSTGPAQKTEKQDDDFGGSIEYPDESINLDDIPF
jgi:single-strand DNA-binding protein